MRNRNKRVVSTGLALSMLLSMIPLHTMAAEPGNTQAGYKDPWNASASIPVLEKKDDTSKLIFGWGPGKTILYIHDNNGLSINATDSWRSITITKIEEQLAEYILNNKVRFD